jgi:hypothetical protein
MSLWSVAVGKQQVPLMIDVSIPYDRALQPATKSPYAYACMYLLKDSDLLHPGKIKTLIGDSLLAPDAKTVMRKV